MLELKLDNLKSIIITFYNKTKRKILKMKKYQDYIKTYLKKATILTQHTSKNVKKQLNKS